jgi:hypothetical protein
MASRSRPAKRDLISEVATRSLDKARAWRFVLATRLMGVRPMDDQASDTLRDMFDGLIALRCELNAVHASLVESGVLDPDDVIRRIGEAAEELNATYEKVFPGLWVDDEGVIRFDESGRVTSDPTGAPN